jgi:threonine/homoserine/homoserine lactone efflux protein
MLTYDQFFPFLGTVILLTLAPGPDNMLVLSVGMAKGRLRGMAFGLGCALGTLSHTLLAVIGISALIAASPMAFTAFKVCGGLYLAWLGIGALRSRGAGKVGGVDAVVESPRALMMKGAIAAAINPKVALFFLSFLPQFVVASHGHVTLQTALLGLTFAVQATVLFGLLGYFSGSVGAWLNRKPKAGVWLDRVAGVVFIGLGLRLIIAR